MALTICREDPPSSKCEGHRGAISETDRRSAVWPFSCLCAAQAKHTAESTHDTHPVPSIPDSHRQRDDRPLPLALDDVCAAEWLQHQGRHWPQSRIAGAAGRVRLGAVVLLHRRCGEGPQWQRASHGQPRRGHLRRRARRRDAEEGAWWQLRAPRRLAVGKQPRAGRRRLRRQSRLGAHGHVRPADQPGLEDTARRLHDRLRSVPSCGALRRRRQPTIPASACSGRKSCSEPRST